MRRGLTLIEVVAATALLTLIVAASVPILASARRDLAAIEPASEGSDAALEEAVDDLLVQRRDLVPELLEHPEGLDLRWQSGERECAATATILTTARAEDDEHRSSHCWVRFRTEDGETVRWMRLPRLREGGGP